MATRTPAGHLGALGGARRFGLRGLFAAFVGAAFLAPWAAQAEEAWPKDIPSQVSAPVTDLSGLLSADATQRLNAGLQDAWTAGRFQLAVLIVPSLDRPIEDLSIQVARGWGLGSKEASNGVLLLIAPNSRRLRIEVGSRLEGVLPDIVCRRIIADVMAPRLRAGDADGAVLMGVAAIAGQIDPKDPFAAQMDAVQGTEEQGRGAPGMGGFPLILLLIAVVALLRIVSMFSGGGWGGGWGGGGFRGGGGGFSGGGASGGW
jgi:uncharacterized protein